MKLITVFQRDELEKLQYSIIIECWKRVMQSGSIKRRYEQTFTEKEREIIAKQYKVYSTWYWKTGTPESHIMTISNYKLMLRAVDFFANI